MTNKLPPKMRVFGAATVIFPPQAEMHAGSWKVELYSTETPTACAIWIVSDYDKTTNWVATDFLNDRFRPADPLAMWDSFERWVEDGGLMFPDKT